MAMVRERPTLDYDLIGEPIRNGLTAAVNILDRDPPEGLRHVAGLPGLLMLTTRTVQSVYGTILLLCSEKREPEVKLEYAVCAWPLARIIADALTTVAFVLADPEPYTRWYWATGWRSYSEQIATYEKRARPEEAEWIAQQRRELIATVQRWQIPAHWVAKPKLILRWPNVGKLSRECLHMDLRPLFAYVEDWLYGLLSSTAHLTAPGLQQTAIPLLEEDPDKREANLDRLRSDGTFIAITLTVAYLSELKSAGVNVFHLPFVWGVISPSSQPAEELYDLRYRTLLERAG